MIFYGGFGVERGSREAFSFIEPSSPESERNGGPTGPEIWAI